MKHQNQSLRNLLLAAMFLAIGLVLPFFTGQIKEIGNMLLPMHLPVFLCALICGWQYGAFALRAFFHAPHAYCFGHGL